MKTSLTNCDQRRPIRRCSFSVHAEQPTYDCRREHVSDTSAQVNAVIVAFAVGKVDDLHFLKVRTTSREISNQFKYISNEFPLTIVFIGIGLRQRGLYSDGEYAGDVLGQSGRRITGLTMREFTIDDDAGRREWRQLLLAIEKRIVLADKQRGMLADDLSDYLWERSSGRIGSLMALITRGCNRTVNSGAELLTRKLLEQIRNDEASEHKRADLRAAFAAGRLTTRIKRVRRTR
jgi:hypothetical protein